MNDSSVRRDAAWMRYASVGELQEFVKVLDELEDSPRRRKLLEAFNKECDRRASEDYARRSGGEWI